MCSPFGELKDSFPSYRIQTKLMDANARDECAVDDKRVNDSQARLPQYVSVVQAVVVLGAARGRTGETGSCLSVAVRGETGAARCGLFHGPERSECDVMTFPSFISTIHLMGQRDGNHVILTNPKSEPWNHPVARVNLAARLARHRRKWLLDSVDVRGTGHPKGGFSRERCRPPNLHLQRCTCNIAFVLLHCMEWQALPWMAGGAGVHVSGVSHLSGLCSKEDEPLCKESQPRMPMKKEEFI